MIGLIQLGCGAVTSLILGSASNGTQFPLVIALSLSGTLTIIPGAIVIYFVRNYIAKGFALGRV